MFVLRKCFHFNGHAALARVAWHICHQCQALLAAEKTCNCPCPGSNTARAQNQVLPCNTEHLHKQKLMICAHTFLNTPAAAGSASGSTGSGESMDITVTEEAAQPSSCNTVTLHLPQPVPGALASQPRTRDEEVLRGVHRLGQELAESMAIMMKDVGKAAETAMAAKVAAEASFAKLRMALAERHRKMAALAAEDGETKAPYPHQLPSHSSPSN